MTAHYQGEHPQPNFRREHWLSLNGEWEFSFDTDCFDKAIQVPFCYESKRSGIGSSEAHDTVWYRKRFCIPEQLREGHLLLHFDAVDYVCKVWVNGIVVTEHRGGQTGFCADITDAVQDAGSVEIVVRVRDDHSDFEIPRGKQSWRNEPHSIFYTHTTGIWQSVWLEAVPTTYLRSVRITPQYDEKSVQFDYVICGNMDSEFAVAIAFDGKPVKSASVSGCRKGRVTVDLEKSALNAFSFYEDLAWSPEAPRLFTVTFCVNSAADGSADTVHSYFGLRKVSIDRGVFMLNNRPYYQKLILDQGYWPDSLMTAPSDEAFIQDIECVKAMGFNGVRKHQKAESPRFLYHADRMGLLVWGEIGSAYKYSEEYAVKMYDEWASVLMRDYNHPCIVAWVPLNESWGVDDLLVNRTTRAHVHALYQMTKSMDATRPVIDNDGWEHATGDILTIHDYEASVSGFQERYERLENILSFSPSGKQLYVGDAKYSGEPILVTEFGGVCMTGEANQNGAWGYTEKNSQDDFISHLRGLVRALKNSKYIQGYCYTQLADIGKEQNGLLDSNHIPKVPVEIIREMNNN